MPACGGLVVILGEGFHALPKVLVRRKGKQSLSLLLRKIQLPLHKGAFLISREGFSGGRLPPLRWEVMFLVAPSPLCVKRGMSIDTMTGRIGIEKREARFHLIRHFLRKCHLFLAGTANPQSLRDSSLYTREPFDLRVWAKPCLCALPFEVKSE